jgi:hypothetical protein
MARKPADTRNFTLRIRETLGRKLEAAAQRNRHSLNNEIRLRLEDSFRAQHLRDMEVIVADLRVIDARLGLKVTLGGLEEDLATALAEGNYEKAKPLALAWLRTRATAKKTEEGLS